MKYDPLDEPELSPETLRQISAQVDRGYRRFAAKQGWNLEEHRNFWYRSKRKHAKKEENQTSTVDDDSTEPTET